MKFTMPVPWKWALLSIVPAIWALSASAEDRRVIEEVIVTAEKREATVSDTSISITAFGEDMIEDFGIQSADELVNYIPATTRDAYDIRIRGVGRNFRALGGDPGVATYYNGVYSEDFGIAASENGLYDVARVEALRGPQGTLYGRNAIGGALNYISNAPSYELEGEVRAQFGNYDTEEYYGVLSGPLIKDRLAARLVGVKRKRDGIQDGQNGGEDTNTLDDNNFSIAFNWQIADNWEANLRWNDRDSSRILGNNAILDEGVYNARGVRNSTQAINSWRPADATTPGATAFTHPLTGATVYGAPARPGVDTGRFPYSIGAAYGRPDLLLNGAGDLGDVESEAITNGRNDEGFDQNAVTFDLAWDVNEALTIKYVGGYSDFRYTFDQDIDYSDSAFSQYRQTTLEDVYTYSHELQLLWSPNESFDLTLGMYNFVSNRYQNYALKDDASQGRITSAANYGFLNFPLAALGGATIMQAAGLGGGHVRLGEAPLGTTISGQWEGDPGGAVYEHKNIVETEALAAFGQGTYHFNDQWALTLGIRWAEDEKSALENRGGYFPTNFFGAFAGFWPFFGATGAQTPLSATNIFMGNAVASGDPNNPITPVCPIDAVSCANPLQLAGIPISYTSTVSGKDKWDDVTWRVNIDWTPTDNTLIYLSATTGYRAGGYSLGVTDARDVERDPLTGLPVPGAITQPLTYDSEEVISFEIGYKSTFLDDTLQLFVSAYRYEYDGYQDRVDAFDAVRASSVDVVQNAGEATNMGIEFEFTWLPTDNITIGGNYSYTDTEYGEDYLVLDFQNPAVPQGVFGSVTTDPAIYVQNVKGNALKRIPEHKGTVWGNYAWRMSAGTLTANLVYSYTGEYQTTPLDRKIDLTPDRSRTDVSLIFRDNTDSWIVRAFVDNVFDDINLRAVNAGGEGSNFRRTGELLAPRIYGLDVTYRFGAQ